MADASNPVGGGTAATNTSADQAIAALQQLQETGARLTVAQMEFTGVTKAQDMASQAASAVKQGSQIR